MAMKDEVVEVTPALAAAWLGTMRRNRSLSMDRVRRYAAIMKAGEWRLTHQGVAFDDTGALADGQHRLQAVLVADVPVKMKVTRGVPAAWWDVIDDMRARTAADALTAKGRRSGRMLSSVLRLVYQYELEVLGSSATEDQPTTHDIVGLDEEYPAAVDAVSWAQGKRLTKNTPMAFLRFILLTKGPGAECEAFCEAIRSGTNLKEGDPAIAARDLLLSQMGAEKRLTNTHLLARLIKAWNAYLAGVPRKALRWNREEEPFPKIYLEAKAAQRLVAAREGKGI